MKFNTCFILGELAMAALISWFLILRYRRYGMAGLRHIDAGFAIIGLMLLGAVWVSLIFFPLNQLLHGEGDRVWHQLPTPPEPAIEILGYERVYWQTSSPTLFPGEDGGWTPATLFRTEGGIYACVAAKCRKLDQLPDSAQLCDRIGSPVLQPSAEVANSLEVVCDFGSWEEVYDFALLKNGQAFHAHIWTVSPAEDAFLAGCIGGIVGLIAGVIIVVVISLRVKRRNVDAETPKQEVGGNANEPPRDATQ